VDKQAFPVIQSSFLVNVNIHIERSAFFPNTLRIISLAAAGWRVARLEMPASGA
jgi:hypothetical protein